MFHISIMSIVEAMEVSLPYAG